MKLFVIWLDDSTDSDVNSLTHRLFCKAANDTFDWVPIQSIVLPRYVYKESAPVIIKESAKTPSFAEQRGQSGSLLLRCSSAFTIESDVVMDGSGLMPGSGGGTIRIISSNGTVTNKGALRCNGLNGGRGGDIYIMADSFVNEGKMECDQNGRIVVFCTTLMNHNEY